MIRPSGINNKLRIDNNPKNKKFKISCIFTFPLPISTAFKMEYTDKIVELIIKILKIGPAAEYVEE